MTDEAMRTALADVATGLVTPFDEDGEIDHDALAENAQALNQQGIDLFFACGNISEYHALTHEERIAVTETSVTALPDDATVLAGIGGSIPTAVELGNHAEAAGCDAHMVMPPDHTFKHEAGLRTYYRRIGDRLHRPLIPYLRRFSPSIDFVAALTEMDPVAGIKWAIDDVPAFGDAVAAGSDDVVWLNGLGERHAIAMHAQGATGMASGIGNFEPAIGRSLFAALEANDYQRAREIRAAARPYMRFREATGTGNSLAGGQSVAAVKAGLDLAGLTGGHVRPPLVDLDEAAREQAASLYTELEGFCAGSRSH